MVEEGKHDVHWLPWYSDNVSVVENRELRVRTHGPPIRLGRISEGSQYNKFPSSPMTYPSSSGVFQILSFESISTLQMRINPSEDADANLMYPLSDEGRKTTQLTNDETFTLNKSSPVDVFHTWAVLSIDPETKYLASGEKQTEHTPYSCALIGSRVGSPLLACHILIVLSLDPDRMYKSSWE